MKFATSLFTLAALATSALSASVRWDSVYDNPDGALTSVACSNGPHGLIPRFNKFKDLPTFPNIGGASAVTGWNSAKCGSCWKLTFNPGAGAPARTINVLAIDYTASGFNIAQTAMNNLTNGHAVEYGVVDVTSVEVPASECGL